jgi:hypothetical protein
MRSPGPPLVHKPGPPPQTLAGCLPGAPRAQPLPGDSATSRRRNRTKRGVTRRGTARARGARGQLLQPGRSARVTGGEEEQPRRRHPTRAAVGCSSPCLLAPQLPPPCVINQSTTRSDTLLRFSKTGMYSQESYSNTAHTFLPGGKTLANTWQDNL